MSKQIKITFKQHKSKGLSAIGDGMYMEVFHKKQLVGIVSGGSISRPMMTFQLKVHKNIEEMVKSPNCPWKWAIYGIHFNKSQTKEIKQYLRDNITYYFNANEVYLE